MSAHTRLVPDRLVRWPMAEPQQLDRGVSVAEHALPELAIFADAGLAELIDRHPRSDWSINTMGTDPSLPNQWREGDPGSYSGAELLEMVGRGRLWINLRRVTEHHAELADIVQRLYAGLEAAHPGLATFQHNANLLISSPGALVYYHLDTPLNILWHIRGRKRVWTYPCDAQRVDPATLPRVIAGEHSEDLYYEPAFDDASQQFDLQPGQVITWPQHTPHRVTNLEGLNVSLSTEHLTRPAQRRNNVLLANHYFQRFCPWGFESTESRGWCGALKEGAIRVARRMPWFDQDAMRGFRYPISFVVDPDAPECLRLLDTHESAAPTAIPQPVV